jgi:16S rRNA (guanine966-N2)-methyltransferase
MRESVFSSLGPLIEGSRCLDLFAGTGAYGLEALSRGADSVIFVENHTKALQALEVNRLAVLKSLEPAKPASSIAKADVFQWCAHAQVDIIFVDPPYSFLEKQGLLLLKRIADWLQNTPQARIILEAPGDWQSPQCQGIECIKRLGKTGKLEPSALIYACTKKDSAPTPRSEDGGFNP